MLHGMIMSSCGMMCQSNLLHLCFNLKPDLAPLLWMTTSQPVFVIAVCLKIILYVWHVLDLLTEKI